MISVKRALWLLNHTTLRHFEVPLLEKLGYEVYLPKMFPYDEGNMSASVDWSYDSKLSIPKEALDILNKTDFYAALPDEVTRIMNQYFDIAIFGFFPKQLSELIFSFQGNLILRPFGLSNGINYTSLTIENCGVHIIQRLEKIRDRFWFGQAYENLSEIEQGVYKHKAVTLPIGLKNAYVSDSWIGNDSRVLFICPRINTSPYFNQIYKNFKKNFGRLPHLIGGAQPIHVQDKNVAGYLPKAEFDHLMNNLKVMFYHSQEKRHLHYHPLEAVKVGMPLIFMAGGMLDHLGGETLPGRCRSIKEAQRKINRVLSGDLKFIEQVRKSQSVLLEQVTENSCVKIWRENFQKIEKSQSLIRESENKKKIVLFLPILYRGGTLDTIKHYAKMIKMGAQSDGKQIDVIFAHIKSSVYSENEFNDLTSLGISVRQYNWEVVNSSRLKAIQHLIGYNAPISEQEYLIPNDGINNFIDCDYWMIVSDRLEKPIAPIRPYCILITDYIQRYVPQMFGEYYEHSFIQSVRNATLVLANTPQTAEDCVQYAGVSRERVKLAPLVVELNQTVVPKSKTNKDYFIWTTNRALHKNHLRTLEGILEYVQNDGKLRCVVTGVDTELFNIEKELDSSASTNEYINSIRNVIIRNPVLKEKIKFMGELHKNQYYKVLAGAKFLLHNVLIDNGTFCAIEAAEVGVPTLSSDYPAMRYISERFSLNCDFFNPYNTNELTEKLFQMEMSYEEKKNDLPSHKNLKRFSWENQVDELWRIMKSFVK